MKKLLQHCAGEFVTLVPHRIQIRMRIGKQVLKYIEVGLFVSNDMLFLLAYKHSAKLLPSLTGRMKG